MVVPGESSGGIDAKQVATHEYGHHVAFHRLNPPWLAVEWGPKRWASYLDVCARAATGTVFPGDEGQHYRPELRRGLRRGVRALNNSKARRDDVHWPIVDTIFYPDTTGAPGGRAGRPPAVDGADREDRPQPVHDQGPPPLHADAADAAGRRARSRSRAAQGGSVRARPPRRRRPHQARVRPVGGRPRRPSPSRFAGNGRFASPSHGSEQRVASSSRSRSPDRSASPTTAGETRSRLEAGGSAVLAAH